MATKEEHDQELRKYEQEHLLRAAQDARSVLAANMRWQAAEALAERDAAREELKGKALEVEDVLRRLAEAHAELGMRSYAPPAAESAPVVGGVTEDLIDAICDSIQPPHRALGLLVQLRKEIRATKRVDVEAIRTLANDCFPHTRGVLLRAIGDEPAAEAPSPEPAAQEGPFRSRVYDIPKARCQCGATGFIHRLDAVCVARDADDEVEQLRARVAELEEQLGTRDTDRIWRSLHNPYDAIERECAKQKARADAAEAKLAALGENPIQRELVERHRHVSLFRRTVETLDSILAGRGPEVAS